MSATTDQRIDSFVAMVKGRGVPIRAEDNASRLRMFEEKLPKRMPQSFESLLSRYSFPAFDVLGITLFDWEPDLNKYTAEAEIAHNETRTISVEILLMLIFDKADFGLRRNASKPIANSLATPSIRCRSVRIIDFPEALTTCFFQGTNVQPRRNEQDYQRHHRQ